MQNKKFFFALTFFFVSLLYVFHESQFSDLSSTRPALPSPFHSLCLFHLHHNTMDHVSSLLRTGGDTWSSYYTNAMTDSFSPDDANFMALTRWPKSLLARRSGSLQKGFLSNDVLELIYTRVKRPQLFGMDQSDSSTGYSAKFDFSQPNDGWIFLPWKGGADFHGASAVIHDDSIFLVGNRYVPGTQIMRLTSEFCNWTEYGRLARYRTNPLVLSTSNKLIVFGGELSTADLPETMEIFNGSTRLATNSPPSYFADAINNAKVMIALDDRHIGHGLMLCPGNLSVSNQFLFRDLLMGRWYSFSCKADICAVSSAVSMDPNKIYLSHRTAEEPDSFHMSVYDYRADTATTCVSLTKLPGKTIRLDSYSLVCLDADESGEILIVDIRTNKTYTYTAENFRCHPNRTVLLNAS